MATTLKPRSRFIKKLGLVFAGLLALVCFIIILLFQSSTVAHWLITTAIDKNRSQLSVEHIEGSLSGPLILSDIRYISPTQEVFIQTLQIDWAVSKLFNLTLDIESIDVEALKIRLHDIDASEKQGLSKDKPPYFISPITTRINRLTCSHCSIQKNNQELIKFDDLSSELLLEKHQLKIEALNITHGVFQWSAIGEINLRDRYPMQLDVNWQGQSSIASHPLSGVLQLVGDIDDLAFKHNTTVPVKTNLTGNAKKILGDLTWQAKVEVSPFNLRDIKEEYPSATLNALLELVGDKKTLQLSGAVDSLLQNDITLEHKLALSATPKNLNINQWEITEKQHGNKLDVSAQIDVNDNSIQGEVSWQDIRYPFSDSDLFSRQGKVNFAGHVEDYILNGDVNLRIKNVDDVQLNFQGNGNREMLTLDNITLKGLGGYAQANGTINWLDQLTAQMNLHWRDLSWLLKGDQLTSNGQGTVSYQGQHYATQLQVSTTAKQLPANVSTITAVGDKQGIESLEVLTKTLSGEIQTQAKLDWQQGMQWEARVSFHDVNPGEYWQGWDGVLQGELSNQGFYHASKIKTQLDVQNISGQLRGLKINGTGYLALQDQDIEVSFLDVNAGDASIQLAGGWGDAINMTWYVDVPHLATLLPEATGRLSAQGQLQNDVRAPLLTLNAQGENIHWQDYAIGAMNISTNLDLAKFQTVDAKIELEQAVYQDIKIERLQLHSEGAAENHSLNAALATNRGNAKLSLTGQYHNQAWQGVFDHFNLETLDAGTWSLEQGATLRTVFEDDASFNLEASVPGIKANLQHIVDEPIYFNNTHFNLAYSQLVTQMRVTTGIGENDVFSLDVNLPTLDFRTIDFKNQPMEMTTRLTLDDMHWLPALAPDIAQAQGKMHLNASLTGTLNTPQIVAKLSIDQGMLDIPRAGIQLTNIELQGDSLAEENALQYQAKATSGKGTITIKGRTQLDPELVWPTQLSIVGENVELMKIPEAHVIVSPDINIVSANKSVNVSGTVVIPQAKLQPRDISMAVNVSDDMVILGEGINGENREPDWQIFSEVRVIFGERVKFYGYGFEGNIAGNLVLIDAPGKLTAAKGELVIVEGRYRAYGQRLKIENGKLLFAGGPVTNPGLDIRAVRQVEDVVSGIKVRGTMLSPQMELFTQPGIGQANALSYLVLGRPMDSASTQEDGAILFNAALSLGLAGGDTLARQIGDRFGFDEMRVDTGESGDAVFIIGRYLTPRLYISYGVGLIEAMDSMNLRYQLARRWKLVAEKRGDHQGSDLIFTIER